MSERRIGIVMNGVTGRMGRNQHLMNSIAAIRKDGGVPLADGTRLVPDPILVGRDKERIATVAKAAGVEKWTTDFDAALGDKIRPLPPLRSAASAAAANAPCAAADSHGFGCAKCDRTTAAIPRSGAGHSGARAAAWRPVRCRAHRHHGQRRCARCDRRVSPRSQETDPARELDSGCAPRRPQTTRLPSAASEIERSRAH